MNKKLIDLHLHTCYSDGDLTPNELIKLAQQQNIKAISITDHDTLLGIKNVTYKPITTKVIPGIELSAKAEKGRMHILGYNIDILNKELNEKMDELKNNSLYSVLSLINQIKNDYNITFNYEDIQDLINSNHNIGRPDIAKLCIKYGYCSNAQEAFDKYLNPAYDKCRKGNKGLNYKECISLILKSNGIPVLAHPKTLELNKEELIELIENMIDFGLKGIEVYHSSHTQEETNLYLEIANKFNLLISGGSDYHGPIIKPDIKIGTGKNNNLHITDLSVLSVIKL